MFLPTSSNTFRASDPPHRARITFGTNDHCRPSIARITSCFVLYPTTGPGPGAGNGYGDVHFHFHFQGYIRIYQNGVVLYCASCALLNISKPPPCPHYSSQYYLPSSFLLPAISSNLTCNFLLLFTATLFCSYYYYLPTSKQPR